MYAERDFRRAESGLSLIEAIVASFLTLIVVMGVYQTMEWGQRSYVDNAEDVNARSNGRAVLELMAGDIRVAGYAPLGAAFNGIPAGSSTSIRILSDLNRNGVVGTAGETGENLTWVFIGPQPGGVWELQRGIDLNGDGLFTGAGESVETAATDVVQIDGDGDGTLDPFLSYDVAPPATKRVRISFGIRNQTRDPLKKRYDVGPFRSEVALRNRLLQ